MQPADVLANEMLTLLVDAGGTWDVGLSSTMPTLTSGGLTNVTDVADVPHGTVDRDAADWDLTTDPRAAAVVVHLGLADADVSPVAWVLYDGSTAVHAGRLSGGPTSWPEGTDISVPVQLRVPTTP